MKRDPKSSSMIRTFLVYIGVLAVGILILVKAILVQTKEGDELRALAEQVETRFDTLQAYWPPTCPFSKSESTLPSLTASSFIMASMN